MKEHGCITTMWVYVPGTELGYPAIGTRALTERIEVNKGVTALQQRLSTANIDLCRSKQFTLYIVVDVYPSILILCQTSVARTWCQYLES